MISREHWNCDFSNVFYVRRFVSAIPLSGIMKYLYLDIYLYATRVYRESRDSVILFDNIEYLIITIRSRRQVICMMPLTRDCYLGKSAYLFRDLRINYV